jgi:hypothetical protein
MTQTDMNQPNLSIGLKNQHSVLHQLYKLTIRIERTREEIEIS